MGQWDGGTVGQWTVIRVVAVAVTAVCAVGVARAQDTAQDRGVRIGITYAPGTRPALVVVPSARPLLDSVATIVARDLDHSDRFEMVRAPAALVDTADLRLTAALGAQFVVQVRLAGSGPELVLRDGRSGDVLLRRSIGTTDADLLRWSAHAAADEVVRTVTGQAGVASTSLLFVRNGRLWRVEADGHGLRRVPSAGFPSLSPAWSRDGRRIAYTAFVRSGMPIVIQDLVTGAREVVPTTERGLNITPAWSPDGRRLAFAHGTEAGTDIYVHEVGGGVQRLTVGRFSDNLSPTWSPDGSRIAFISTRARTPQLYVMNSDGTDQEVLARFDFGATGATSAPEWSPDGQAVAFHREVNGEPQIFVFDFGTRALRQLTGSGRNEDPTWAPDGRHIAFVSSRGGARNIWVVDLETGRLRQLTTGGGARLPAWSPRLTRN
ncbi:MAG TPA: DPP IV N-terminal domain-containing protein [Gemmatimonadales bacterium]|nr:DPP IV N-terminal domain-containing protein [Gemmatimonadales bacterium]